MCLVMLVFQFGFWSVVSTLKKVVWKNGSTLLSPPVQLARWAHIHVVIQTDILDKGHVHTNNPFSSKIKVVGQTVQS